MATGTRAVVSADPHIDQYRQAERVLWQHYGFEPSERYVDVPGLDTRVRVTEVGAGKPVVFVGGTGGTGPYWAALLQQLPGVRCLVVDRPGFALSPPVSYAEHGFATVATNVLTAVLQDARVEQASIVGASIGNAYALHFATTSPASVDRIALLGSGPLTSEAEVPGFVKMLRTPIGALVVRVPEKPKMLAGMLRGLGHGPSLEAGRIPEAYLQWHMALHRHTKTMHHERSMVQAVLGPSGFRPGLLLDDAQLAAITQPVLMVYGSADAVGSPEIWRRFVGRLPAGEFHLVDGGGHIPWLDDAAGVGSNLSRFLTG